MKSLIKLLGLSFLAVFILAACGNDNDGMEQQRKTGN